MGHLDTAAKLLQAHGAWGVCVILGFVIWRLAHYIQVMQTQHQETIQRLLLDHNKEQREETKQLVTALTSTDRALQAINQTLNALLQRRD